VNLIEVDNVSFAYTEGIPVLKNVTFSLNSGSVAIIGQNGSGKTTLVKLLKALLKPISGDIFINGINTKETTAAKLARTVGWCSRILMTKYSRTKFWTKSCLVH